MSAFIFLVALGALQGYWHSVNLMMANSRVRIAAGFVAEQLMEEILAKGYDKVDEIPKAGSLSIDLTIYGRSQSYKIAYTLNSVDVTKKLKSVEINLSSTGTKDLAFETLLYKKL